MPFKWCLDSELRLCDQCNCYVAPDLIRYYAYDTPSQDSICEHCLESPHFGRIMFVKQEVRDIREHLAAQYTQLKKQLGSLHLPLVFGEETDRLFDDHPKIIAAYHKLRGPKPMDRLYYCHLHFQMTFDEFVDEFAYSTGQNYFVYETGCLQLGKCKVTGVPFELNNPDKEPWPLLRAPERGLVPDHVDWVLPAIWDMKMRQKMDVLKTYRTCKVKRIWATKGLRLWLRARKWLKMRFLAFYWSELALRPRFAPHGPEFFLSVLHVSDLVQCY
jgi:hypothetical protein